MRSNIGARVLLALGFIAASLAYSGWWASRTVFDSAATGRAAHALLASPAVQHDMAQQLGDQLSRQLGRADSDPHVTAAVTTALHDPRVITAFSDAVEEVHAALLGNDRETVTLDTTALTKSVRSALEKEDPQLAARLSKTAAFKADIDSSKLPALGHLHDLGRDAVFLGALAALLMLGCSLLMAHDRKSIGRFGRRLAYMSFPPLVLFVLVPMWLHSGTSGAVAAALKSYRGGVLPSAFALVGAGALIALVAALAPKPDPAANLAPAAPRPPSGGMSLGSPLNPLAAMKPAAPVDGQPATPPAPPSLPPRVPL